MPAKATGSEQLIEALPGTHSIEINFRDVDAPVKSSGSCVQREGTRHDVGASYPPLLCRRVTHFGMAWVKSYRGRSQRDASAAILIHLFHCLPTAAHRSLVIMFALSLSAASREALQP